MKKQLASIVIGMLLFATVLSVAGTIIDVKKTSTGYEDDPWTMFGHDPQNTRYSTSTAPIRNTILWDSPTSDEIRSSPAVVDGKLYVGSNDHKIYCFDGETGTEVWNYTTGGTVSSSPAVVDDKVFVGSNDNKVHCINAETGEYIWDFPTGGSISSSPTVINDKVYIGSSDNNLYCLDMDGVESWHYETGGSIGSAPAVANDKVYVTSYDGNVYCLDAVDGSEIWIHNIGGPLPSSPAVVDGKVYFGTLVSPKVICLDGQGNGDGTTDELWNYQVVGAILSSPAVADGMVYVNSKSYMYRLDADSGQEDWNYSVDVDYMYESSPAVADGKIYFCSGTVLGTIFCLDITDGDKIWTYDIDDAIKSSPAISDGCLYVGSNDGSVYCFYAPPEPDLECEGSLSWTDIKPGETVTGEFTIENVGDENSLLDWEIESHPEDWGVWSFDHESGEDLTPEDGKITIEVEIVAPDIEEETFTGEIKIVNLEDPGNSCIIAVSLTTPVSHESPFMLFLELIWQHFQLLMERIFN